MTEKRSLWKEMGQGIRFVWFDARLRTLAILVAGTAMFASPSQLAVIVLAQQDLHADARLIGIILSVGSASGLLGAALSPVVRRRWRVGQLLIGSTLAIAVASALLATAFTAILLIVGIALVFLAVPIFDITQTSLRFSLTPDEFQGRANSVFQLLFFSSYSFGLAAGGFFLRWSGPRLELWVIAAGFALMALLMLIFRLDAQS